MSRFLKSLLFLLIGFSATAQTRQLNGTVIDPSGQGVISATVKLKGSTTGTSTNADGKFSLTVPEGNSTIEISSVGYVATQIIIAPGQNNITIPLQISNAALS